MLQVSSATLASSPGRSSSEVIGLPSSRQRSHQALSVGHRYLPHLIRELTQLSSQTTLWHASSLNEITSPGDGKNRKTGSPLCLSVRSPTHPTSPARRLRQRHKTVTTTRRRVWTRTSSRKCCRGNKMVRLLNRSGLRTGRSFVGLYSTSFRLFVRISRSSCPRALCLLLSATNSTDSTAA